MALPALAGFGWFATVVAGLFASLIGFFAKYLTKRLAIAAALITAAIAITAAFYAAITGVLALIAPVTPPQFNVALGLFLPSNAKACLSAVMSAYVLRWLYDWQIKVLTYKNAGAGF